VPTCGPCGWRVLAGLVLRRALLLAGAVAGGLASQWRVTAHLVPRVPALHVTLDCESREWAEAVAALNPESDAPPVA
jgi:hypothetical protein